MQETQRFWTKRRSWLSGKSMLFSIHHDMKKSNSLWFTLLESELRKSLLLLLFLLRSDRKYPYLLSHFLRYWQSVFTFQLESGTLARSQGAQNEVAAPSSSSSSSKEVFLTLLLFSVLIHFIPNSYFFSFAALGTSWRVLPYYSVCGGSAPWHRRERSRATLWSTWPNRKHQTHFE